jgi:hypothetical protein
MTDLKALTESCSMEARKLPAAPALSDTISIENGRLQSSYYINAHDEIDPSELLDTALNCLLQILELAHVHGTNPNHLGTGSGCRYVLGNALGLLYITANDAGVGTQVY